MKKGWYRLILNAFGTKIKRKIIGTYIWGYPINFPTSTVYSSPPHSKQKPAKFSLLGIMNACPQILEATFCTFDDNTG
jgi:hypothetical protein